MPVPNQFANVTTSIPLSQLDANFNTPITLGNTAIQLGNTVTTLNNMTLANVTVSSGNVTITNVTVTTANVTTANIANVIVTGTGTFAAGSNTAPSITFTGDTNTGIYSPAADTIAFTEGGVESGRFDSNGRLLVGTSTAITSWGSGAAQQIQATASGVAFPGFSSYAFSTTAGAGGMINLGHSRSTTVGTMTPTQSSDTLGYLIFEGVNSSNALVGGSYISVVQSGAAGASYIPAEMRFFTSDATNGNSEKASITSSGNLRIANGNVVIGTAGKGIDFSADANAATSTSELLDDYEEGTFSPQVYGETTRGTTTYGTSGQVGRYTKIGNRVYFNIWLQWTNATGTGNLLVDGLPFASANVTNGYAPITAYVDGGLALTASYVFQAYIGINTAGLIPAQYPTGGGSATNIAMDTAAAIMLSGCYETA